MKGNIKKLAVFVFIAAIAMFSTAATAWDDSIVPWYLPSVSYAVTGAGSCLIAPGGFTDLTHFEPLLGSLGIWDVGPNTWEGVYTFNRDGTGEFKAKDRFMDVPGPAPGIPFLASAGLANLQWKFTYAVDKGKITFTYKTGMYVANYVYGPNAPPNPLSTLYAYFTDSWYGRISPDGNNLFVTYGVPQRIILTLDQGNTTPFPSPNYVELVCNVVHQGFRTGE